MLRAGYILDFYFTNVRIAIEIDGPIHERQREYDKQRDARLRKRRITVVRFTNDEVFADPDALAKKVVNMVKGRMPKQRKLNKHQRRLKRKRELEASRIHH